MTSFVARTSQHYGVDKIATSPTAQALYENLLAVAEGSLGAPEVKGASKVFIGSATASSSAAIEFTGLSSAYHEYELHMWGVRPETDAVILRARASTDGVSYDSGTNYNDAGLRRNDTASGADFGSAARAYLSLSGEVQVGNPATRLLNGILRIYHPSETTGFKSFQWDTNFVSSSANLTRVIGAGRYLSATAIAGLQLSFGTGNIARGVFALFGVRFTHDYTP